MNKDSITSTYKFLSIKMADMIIYIYNRNFCNVIANRRKSFKWGLNTTTLLLCLNFHRIIESVQVGYKTYNDLPKIKFPLEM